MAPEGVRRPEAGAEAKPLTRADGLEGGGGRRAFMTSIEPAEGRRCQLISPKQINRPATSRKKEQTVEPAIARMPGQLIDHLHFIRTLQNHKVTNIQNLPELEEAMT